MKTMTKEKSCSKRQAELQLKSIKEKVEALSRSTDEKRDCASLAILEDPLSVQVRSGWHNAGWISSEEEYQILLRTSKPCRIIGNLNKYKVPETVEFQHQDWFTPWIEYPISKDEEEILLQYAQCFYFGE